MSEAEALTMHRAQHALLEAKTALIRGGMIDDELLAELRSITSEITRLLHGSRTTATETPIEK